MLPERENQRVRNFIFHPDNSHHVSTLSNGVLVLDVGFHIRGKSSTTLAILERGVEAHNCVEGSSIANIQCSFELNLDTGIIMLYDRSFANSTQVTPRRSSVNVTVKFSCRRISTQALAWVVRAETLLDSN